MNDQRGRRLRKMAHEADRELEAAGIMTGRKLLAIMRGNPELQRAVWGAVARKEGKHDGNNTDQAAPAQPATAESTEGGRE